MSLQTNYLDRDLKQTKGLQGTLMTASVMSPSANRLWAKAVSMRIAQQLARLQKAIAVMNVNRVCSYTAEEEITEESSKRGGNIGYSL